MPHVLELCCGWKSVSNCLVQDHGWTATTIDVLPKFKPTICCDVTTWDYRAHFARHPPPDVVWASPPCKSFTVASWSKHRDGQGDATSAEGEKGDACVRACLEIIAHLRTLNPRLLWFVKNPLHGAFRKLECVRPFIERGECRMLQYGDYAPATHSLKPTLVLTNCVTWLPKQMVLRKSVVHWDRLSKKRRTVIPRAVCAEIAHVCCQIVNEELVEGQP
jgi:hypothetical protein